MIYPKPQCEDCKHLFNDKPGYFCKAFPDGIPDEITEGEVSHTDPLPNQKNDIVFEPIKETK
jgi:hypothetical protein